MRRFRSSLCTTRPTAAHRWFSARRRSASQREVGRHGSRQRGDAGLSLIEVMVAFVILMIVLVPLTYLLTNEVNQAASSKNQVAALGLAEKWVEYLSTAQDPPQAVGSLAVDADKPLIPKLPNGTAVPTATIGGTVFTIRSEYTWTGTQDPGTAPDLCTSGGAQVLDLTVTVYWSNFNQQVSDTTVLNFPAPGIPQYGFYRLQMSGATTVNDVGANSWSDRVQAIPVTVTPFTSSPLALGTPVTVYPDQYGCVFAELSPGTYTVSVADPVSGQPVTGDTYGTPSFVQNSATDGSPSEPTSVTLATTASPVIITAGVTTSLTTVSFDEGTTIGLSYPSATATADGVSCPGASRITCLTEGEGTTNSLGQSAVSAGLAWTSGSTWTSAATPTGTATTRIASVACAGSAACLGVGYGYVGATAHGVILSDSATTPGTVTADTVPTLLSGGIVTSLTNVVCPSSTACVAWGVGSTGPVVLAGTISSTGDTWNLVTLPATMTTVSQVACSAALNCVAVGSGSSAGLAASGPIYGTGGAPAAGTWVLSTGVSGLSSLSTLTQVACPADTACMAIGTGKVLSTSAVAPVVISATPATLGSALTWTLDAIPATTTPSALSSVLCASTSRCLVVGTGKVGIGTVQALIYSGAPGIAALTSDTVAITVTALSQMVCPSLSECVAIGASGTSPTILSGALGTPDIWSAGTGLGSITSVSAISCPNASTCAVAASTTGPGPDPQAAILYGTPATIAAWSTATLPSADSSALYLTGISCTPTSGTSTCAAVGASSTGATVMMSTNGPGGSWADHSTDIGLSLTGSPTSPIPVELTNGSLINPLGSNGYWNAVPATGTTNTTSISDIFPFAGGYGLYAGECVAEDSTNGPGSTIAQTSPGATATTPATTVPLAVLPIQVNSATGPESADTLSLTPTTGGCSTSHSYPLQSTGPDGLSRTEVPFGLYTLTVKLPAGTTKTFAINVSPGTVTVAGTTYSLPGPIAVTGP